MQSAARCSELSERTSWISPRDVHVHVRMCMCMYVYVYVGERTSPGCACAHVRMCMCMYVYVYVCERTSWIRPGMPSAFAKSDCVIELLVTRESTACAACACGASANVPNHVMSGGIPPNLAIAAWLLAEALVKEEHVMSTWCIWSMCM